LDGLEGSDVVSNSRWSPLPVGDVGVDGLDLETKDTQIAGRVTGPGIWVSSASMSERRTPRSGPRCRLVAQRRRLASQRRHADERPSAAL
jgi:hypothetical protein